MLVGGMSLSAFVCCILFRTRRRQKRTCSFVPRMHEHRDTHFANSQYMGAAKTYQQPFTQRPAPISVPVRGGRARRGHGRSRGRGLSRGVVWAGSAAFAHDPWRVAVQTAGNLFPVRE